MFPDSGIGYEKWILIFVIGEPPTLLWCHKAITVSHSLVCSIVHCSCVGQHLAVLTHSFELSSHPWLPLLHALRVATRVTPPSSLRWTKGHLASSLLWGLAAVAFLPCISLYSPVRHASLGLGLSRRLSPVWNREFAFPFSPLACMPPF